VKKLLRRGRWDGLRSAGVWFRRRADGSERGRSRAGHVRARDVRRRRRASV